MPLTEREIILRERAAYDRGAADRFRFDRSLADYPNPEKAYPLPKISRPRVVNDVEPSTLWRFVDGVLQAKWGERWLKESTWKVTAERIAIWADLLARPNDEFEDDGSAECAAGEAEEVTNGNR